MRIGAVVLSSCVLLAAGGVARGGDLTSVTASIPFAFGVAGQQLPAGRYTFEMNAAANQLSIRGRKRLVVRASTLQFVGDVYEAKGHFEISFSRYDDERFLSQIWIESSGMELPRSDAEQGKLDAGVQAHTVKLKVKPE